MVLYMHKFKCLTIFLEYPFWSQRYYTKIDHKGPTWRFATPPLLASLAANAVKFAYASSCKICSNHRYGRESAALVHRHFKTDMIVFVRFSSLLFLFFLVRETGRFQIEWQWNVLKRERIFNRREWLSNEISMSRRKYSNSICAVVFLSHRIATSDHYITASEPVACFGRRIPDTGMDVQRCKDTSSSATWI